VKIVESDFTSIVDELIEQKKIIREDEALYSIECHYKEVRSAELLDSISRKPSDLIFITKDTITEYIVQFEAENRITLSDAQRDALYYFAEKKVYIITGLPGAGKTESLKAIVGLIKKLKLSLTCMAPTGIAAKKMAVTIGHDAFTIHRRLGFKGNTWTYGESNKYETDVAILDEASMIDQDVFFRLLSALRDRTHRGF
jgi:exodeoxyribonuclease V alpha subunit